MADEHWDNPQCKWDLLKRHHEEARERNAPILKFGDLFCAMQGSWDPRKSKSKLRPEHQVDNYLDALVETGVDWYEPWMDLIALVCPGNHEESIVKRHETDLIDRFCQRLQDRGGVCRRGGYGGYVKFQVRVHGTKNSSLKMYYHHGFGGGGPVTKGTIDFNRYSEMAEADIYVAGHVHRKNLNEQRRWRLTEQNVVKQRRIHYVRVGTYKDEADDCFSGGYHNQRGRGPRPLGGYWMRLTYKELKGGLIAEFRSAD